MDHENLEQLIERIRRLPVASQKLIIRDIALMVETESEAKQESAYDAFLRIGAIGCIDGPPDLSSNPEHMKDFGKS